MGKPKLEFEVHAISADVAIDAGPDRAPEPRPNSRMIRTSGTMHEDAYASDRSCARGPTGKTHELRIVQRKREMVALSPGFVTLPDGRFVTLSCARNSFYLVLVDATATKVLAMQRVPAPHTRLVGHVLRRKRAKLFRRIVGSAYYFVENAPGDVEPYRIVLPTPKGEIRRYRIGADDLREEDTISLEGGGTPSGALVPPTPQPDPPDDDDDDDGPDAAEDGADDDDDDALVGAVPNPDPMAPPVYTVGHGGIVCVAPEDGATSTGYWVVYRDGTTCLVTPSATGVSVLSARAAVDTTPGLPDEIVANSIAVGPRGAYVLTTRRLVRVYVKAGALATDLGPRYENVNTRKPGQLSPGSGTTPTLSTDAKYVYIVDNAQRMSLVVYDADSLAGAGDGKPLASLPVFDDARECACENSVIAVGDRLIVGNTADYSNPFMWGEKAARTKPRGISVMRFDPAAKSLVRERVLDVDPGSVTMKASELDGRLYLYAPESVNGKLEWSMRAYDPATGDLVFRCVLFRDDDYEMIHDNAWATLALQSTPTRSRIMVGLFKGFAILEGPR